MPIRGYGGTNGNSSVFSFVNRFGQCFLRGVYMSTMLILGAEQYEITLSENTVKGFGHGDNCAYTGKFYS